MSQRQIQKEKTRRKILDCAYEVYATYGFSATTKQIAIQSNLSHGTIFSHFPDVESLLIAVIEDFDQHVTLASHSLANSQGSIKDLLYTHLDILVEYEDFYRRLISEVDRLPESVKYTYIVMQATVSNHLSHLIDEAKEKKQIKNLPIHFIFNSWIGLVHYYIANKDLFNPNGKVLESHREELVESFIIMLMN